MQTTPQCLDVLELLDSPAPTFEAYMLTKSVESDAMYGRIQRAINDLAGGVDESELTKLSGIVERISANNPTLADLYPMPKTLQ